MGNYSKLEKEQKQINEDITNGFMDCKKEWLAGKSIKELMDMQVAWELNEEKSYSYVAGWSHSIYDRCDDEGWSENNYIAVFCNYPHICKIEDLTLSDGISALERQLTSSLIVKKKTFEELEEIGNGMKDSDFKLGWLIRLNANNEYDENSEDEGYYIADKLLTVYNCNMDKCYDIIKDSYFNINFKRGYIRRIEEFIANKESENNGE